MMNQRTATVSTILSVFKTDGIDFKLNGDINALDIVTDIQRTKIVNRIVEGFLSNEIEMSAEGKSKYFNDPKELRKYVVGLVNNWFRKATELNGGKPYTPKNPGSRQGQGDAQLKALRELLKQTDDEEAKAEIEVAIEQRRIELKPKSEIDVSALPAHLRHLVK